MTTSIGIATKTVMAACTTQQNRYPPHEPRYLVMIGEPPHARIQQKQQACVDAKNTCANAKNISAKRASEGRENKEKRKRKKKEKR
jgi:hypothetical protein